MTDNSRMPWRDRPPVRVTRRKLDTIPDPLPPRRMIPVEEVFPEWHLDPEYVMVYVDLKDEFDGKAQVAAPEMAGGEVMGEDSTPLFADVLLGAMMDADVNSSELARRVWGTIKDKRGYDVARNRDRVGQYLRGTSYPEPANLQKIADALGVPVAELALARRPGRVIDVTARALKTALMALQSAIGEVAIPIEDHNEGLTEALLNAYQQVNTALEILQSRHKKKTQARSRG